MRPDPVDHILDERPESYVSEPSLCSWDMVVIFLGRFVRLFSYGMVAVVLYLHTDSLGFTTFETGALFTCILLGDLVMTFLLTTNADAWGRRRTMFCGAALKVVAGFGFAYVRNFWLLALIGAVGVITPTGGEIGPFLAVEQAALTQLVGEKHRDKFPLLFGWYNMVGYLAQAAGGVSCGYAVEILQKYGYQPSECYRIILIVFGFIGVFKMLLSITLTSSVESNAAALNSSTWFGKFGLHREQSKAVVVKLSLLFMLDSFAGGFVMQTLIVYWFYAKYGTSAEYLGLILMISNILSGVSALLATPLVNWIGPIKTMVVTHLPSNLFLLLVPFMPSQLWAVIVLFARFTISQMDVPARQAYVAVVVEENERSAAGGITNIARSVGLAVAPMIAGYLVAGPADEPLFMTPWIIAGGLKIVYDLLVWYLFTTSQNTLLKPPSEATSLLKLTSRK